MLGVIHFFLFQPFKFIKKHVIFNSISRDFIDDTLLLRFFYENCLSGRFYFRILLVFNQLRFGSEVVECYFTFRQGVSFGKVAWRLTMFFPQFEPANRIVHVFSARVDDKAFNDWSPLDRSGCPEGFLLKGVVAGRVKGVFGSLEGLVAGRNLFET